ncbi:hypothetical protein [Saccharopolyspora halophila]|uniref:hypothetical protein n=1 Tax=Saccharopolyspora halophila TaxID=405551 RepID=UPI0031D58F49
MSTAMAKVPKFTSPDARREAIAGPYLRRIFAGAAEQGVEAAQCLSRRAFTAIEFHHGDPGDELDVELPGCFALGMLRFPGAAELTDEGEFDLDARRERTTRRLQGPERTHQPYRNP